MRHYQLIDTETGGLDPASAGVCELSIIEVDPQFNVLQRFYSLIDPEHPISASAAGVHGIRDVDVANAPTMHEYLYQVLDGSLWSSGELVFIAHNAKFDYKFLEPYIACDVVLCDTLKLARRIYPDAPDHKMQTLRHWLELPFEKGDAHSAAGDTQVLYHLVERMLQDAGVTLAQLVVMANEFVPIAKMPFGKYRDIPLEQVEAENPSYFDWMLKQDLDTDLRRSIELVHKPKPKPKPKSRMRQ